ncbi:geranylgeranyl pyrophosphate synthetase [Tirmania nivea]|nr:geranylgeranyl pyrophosphate synthetase [Tirmania nivea]
MSTTFHTAPRILAQWTVADLKKPATSVSKKDFEFLSSYNWSELKSGKLSNSTIIVPGCPSSWEPPALPKAVRPDHGLVFVDQNAYQHPNIPLEPLLQALYITKPSFDLNKVQIITDRNNLRKLFEVVCGEKHRDFEIAVEIVNNTALFTRLEQCTSELIGRQEFRGYGHEFEKEFTKYPSSVNGSTGHHRIVSYSFGGLNMVVRFEADGALPPARNPVGITKGTPARSSGLILPDLSSLSLEGRPPRTTPASSGHGTPASTSRLAVMKAGELVPQDRILEIKTRAEHRAIGIPECMPQLWFSDTRNLFIGLHNRGTFRTINKYQVDEKMTSQWEKLHERQLGQLVDLLGKIIAIAKGSTGRTKVRGVQGRVTLEEWQATHGPAARLTRLPEDLRALWSVKA